MDSLSRLVVFNKVVQNQSFSKAAKELGLTRSMVSQHVSKLEEDLGTKLLNRTTRSLAVTEAGQMTFEGSQAIVEEYGLIRERLQSLTLEPEGLLRLTTPYDVGTEKLPNLLRSFTEKHPKVQIDLSLNDEVVNLIDGQFDLSIRVGWLRDSSFHATKIADFVPVLCASQAYIDQHGQPNSFEELLTHKWGILNILENPFRWDFTNKNGGKTSIKLDPQFSTNSPAGLKSLVMSGACLGVCPDYQIGPELGSGEVVRLLPGESLRKAGIYAVYPSQVMPLKVRAFVDHLKSNWG
jgi:DNA-binding transcriptional LysR family regulator